MREDMCLVMKKQPKVRFREKGPALIFLFSENRDDWVCSKFPHDGRIKKDCIPKV